MHLETLVAIQKNLLHNLPANVKEEHNYDMAKLIKNFRVEVGYNQGRDLLKNLKLFDDCLEIICLMKDYCCTGFQNVPQSVRD